MDCRSANVRVRHVTSRRASVASTTVQPRKFSVHDLPYNPTRFSMVVQSENHTEDLESPSSDAPVASIDEKVTDRDESSTKPKLAPSTGGTTNGKRQRTLFDMFGSAPNKDSNTPSKKPKLTASGPSGNEKISAVSSSSGGSSSGGLQALNSIPFSSREYVDSLTGDQKRLLTLECETMGKSW